MTVIGLAGPVAVYRDPAGDRCYRIRCDRAAAVRHGGCKTHYCLAITCYGSHACGRSGCCRDPEGPHHLIVFVLHDMAVPYIEAGYVKVGLTLVIWPGYATTVSLKPLSMAQAL